MSLIDTHCHFFDEALVALQQQANIRVLYNCSNLAELALGRDLKSRYPNVMLSLGIHPWHVDKADKTAVMQAMQSDDVLAIGEIGLDNSWCETPIAQQCQYFEAQLEIAQQLNKPVVIHVKGLEAQLLEYIVQYPNRYYIHWYSDETYLAQYIDAGCYMSVAADALNGISPHSVAAKIPLSQLFIETDGISAAQWALDKAVNIDNYQQILSDIYQTVADYRGIELQNLINQVNRNFDKWSHRE